MDELHFLVCEVGYISYERKYIVYLFLVQSMIYEPICFV